MDPAGAFSHISTAQSASSFATTPSSTPPTSPGQSRLSSRVPEAARRARARRDWTPPEWKPALSRREGAFIALFFVLYAVTWVRLFGAEIIGRGKTTAVTADELQRNATLVGFCSAALAGDAVKAICEAGGEDEFGIGEKHASGYGVVSNEAVEGRPVFGSVSEENMEGVHTCPCNAGVKLGGLGVAAVGEKCGCGCAETGVCNCKKNEKAAVAPSQDTNDADFATPVTSPVLAEASRSTPGCGCGAKNKLSLLGVPAPAKKCDCGCAETGSCKCGQKTERVNSSGSDIASVVESEDASFQFGKADEQATVEVPSCGCGGGAKNVLSVLDAPVASKKCGCVMKTGACTCDLEVDESVLSAGASAASDAEGGKDVKTESESKKCGCGMKTGACTCDLEVDESVSSAGASAASDAEDAEYVKAESESKVDAPDSDSVEEAVAPDSTSQGAGKDGLSVLGTKAAAKKCACGCAETGVCKCAGGAQSPDAETCRGDAADVGTKAIPSGLGTRVGAIAQSLKGLFVGKKLESSVLSSDIDSTVEAAEERLAESVDSGANGPDSLTLVDDSEGKSASVPSLGSKAASLFYGAKDRLLGKTVVKSSEVLA